MARIFSPLLPVLAMAVVVAMFLAGGPAALAADARVTQNDARAIRQVIADQIEAFQRDDGEAAFAYASPAIRAKFGTPERFMDMVREDYRPVYRPREIAFWELVAGNGEGDATQQVMLVGPDGTAIVALYQMRRQPDGDWRIDGVRLIRSPQQRA